jgi:hypothetical protein
MAADLFDREVVTAWKGHGIPRRVEIDGRKFWTVLEYDTIFSSKEGTWYLYKAPWTKKPIWFRMEVYEGSRIQALWPKESALYGQFVWNVDNITISLEKRYNVTSEASRREFLVHVRDHNPRWIVDFDES